MNKRIYLLLLTLALGLEPLGAMHIMEGFIPLKWCIIWYLIALPFVVFSYRFVARQIKASPRMKSSFALAAAYTFILSALKMPSVAGSSSHLTGTTLGTLTIGPMAMPLVGAIVLLFQALLLAHGGISTLGANIFSLSIAGPFVAYALFRLLTSARLPKSLVIFIATFCGSMATYIVTSFQLAVVYPDAITGVMGAAWKFLGIFAITQVPLSIIEGILTVIVLRLLEKSQAKTATSVKASSTKSSTESSLRPQFIWLSILAVVCLALPILAGLFDIGAGTDDQAGEMIGRLTPGFNPTPFLESFEPSEFAEPLLFALQVAIGIALFAWGYYQLIYKKHQSKQKEQEA